MVNNICEKTWLNGFNTTDYIEPASENYFYKSIYLSLGSSSESYIIIYS